MLSVSAIKTYMYCPLKLYFQSQIDESYEEDDYFVSKTLKDLRIDVQDILHKNLRRVKRDMDLNEIEETLSEGVFKQVDTTFEIIEEISESKRKDNDGKSGHDEGGEKNDYELRKESQSKQGSKNQDSSKGEKIEFLDEEKRKRELKLQEEELEKEELERLKEELNDEINLTLKILTLKTSQAMKTLNRDGDKLRNTFFQSCMYNFLIRDIGVGLIGVIDKIEVENGKYFPILLKTSNPPLRGVWDGDRMEVIANAILVEEEFHTHITVGFVDYLKIGERRPVVIDSTIRKKFFKMLKNINKIVENGEIPTVKANLKKCRNCEYNDLCEKV